MNFTEIATESNRTNTQVPAATGADLQFFMNSEAFFVFLIFLLYYIRKEF